MAKFENAIGYVLSNEGFFSNRPNDPGGPTNWGISLRFLQSIGEDIDGDGDTDIEDIKALTRTDAIILYAQKFWKPLGLDKIESEAVAMRVFDMSVNMGIARAVKIAQRAYNAAKGDAGARLKIDGKFGPKTRKAMDAIPPEEMMPALRQAHEKYYVDLVNKRPELEEFLKGWLARARK